MRVTAILISILAATAATAADSGETPFMLQAGGTYLSSDVRDAIGENWGVHGGIATCIAEAGLVGLPSADVDGRYASGSTGRLMVIETSYTERFPLDSQNPTLYAGFGIGAHYARLELDDATGKPLAEQHKWGVGGKVLLGMRLGDRLFIEGTYHHSSKLLECDTSSISISLGYWF